MMQRKNRKQNIVALMCAIALVISGNGGVTADAAAKPVKLAKSSLALTVGKSKTITVKKAAKVVIKKKTFSTSNKKIATVTKKGKVTAKSVGKTTVKVKVKYKKGKRVKTTTLKCKVTVSGPASKTEATQTPAASATATTTPTVTAVPSADTSSPKLIYDAAETAEEELPYVANYDEFKYGSFQMYLCKFNFYGEGPYQTEDYRGKSLHYELTIKNSGQRDLPILAVRFTCTTPEIYPIAFCVYDPDLSDQYGSNDDISSAETKLVQKISQGETYTYSFDYTIPKNAQNEDCDEDGNQYPVMMYIPNLKDMSPYTDGDEITVLGLKIYE